MSSILDVRHLKNYQAMDHLLDGRSVLVRAIRPDDKQALLDGLHRLSAQSVYFRFFYHKHDLSEKELVYFTEVDFQQHVALVAFLPDENLPVGVGRFIICETQPRKVADIAFAVDDAHHGIGIATVLLRHMVDIARVLGVQEFRANVLAENSDMLEVLFHSGLPHRQHSQNGVVDIELTLEEESA